ncbi:MAG: lysoplasmalogenase [Sphingobacteriales bacterium]|uniref:lysoplasmalogenase n=1 Tax=Hydrotalea flava TaxID=714549 RepID=UPI00082FB87D|nr:lysoplasmalogenase [Hydrotalea flava]RTL56595.1 MAG: lysoplasmalogenase [Sphingobacteriales bacterium]
MRLLKKHGILVFWFFLLADCYLLLTEKEQLQIFTKPLLIPILLFFIFLNAKHNLFKHTKTLVFLAFVFAWIGDILLMGKGTLFFIFGMVAFIVAHIFFIITFLRMHQPELKHSQEAFIGVVILFCWNYLIFHFIGANLGGMKWPILIYMLIISTMAVSTVNLLSSRSKKNLAINFFIPGAALFMISDSVLALKMFLYTDVSFLGVVVMVSYGYALSLLADGFTRYFRG